MYSSFKKIADILKQEGTSRYERYLKALDPASVKIDDRKLQDFIVYAQRYSKNLLFIDADSDNANLSESWEYFFREEHIVLLIANIASRNAGELKATYDTLSGRFTKERSNEHFTELMNFILSRFKKINSWYYSTSAGSSLKDDLTLYIRSYLQTELYSLKEIIFYIRDLGNNNYNLNDFLAEFYGNDNITDIKKLLSHDDIWAIGKKENINLREQIFAGDNEEEKLYSASLILNRIFDAVFHATRVIIQNCQNYFDETINQKQDHPPHITFLIVFIKLYGYVQEELNRIPQRHLEHYYNEVLRIKKKEAIPDQAFVVFELAKGFNVHEIRKGTALTAGKDRLNADLIYETNEHIVINKAKVTSLQTIFIDRDRQNRTLNYYKTAIPVNGTQQTPASADTDASFSIFGEPGHNTISAIGFGIASTQFYLAKGERKVTVIFQLKDNITVDEFDTGILQLLLTGEKGWLNSDDIKSGITIQSLKKGNNQTLELSFTISIAQESAIVAFDSKLHEGNFYTLFPVLQCIIKFPDLKQNQGEQSNDQWQHVIAQLNSLQQLKILGTSIQVQVGSIQPQANFDGIKDLIVESSEAPLDSKKPFYPFSSIPKPGSSFYIGCKDLFYKAIQRLSVNIEWVLPDDFGSYYSKYLPPYDSNKFMASLSILQNKHWKKLNEISVIDKDSGDARFKVIKIDFDKLPPGDAAHPPESTVSTFDNERKNGTLKLKLKYPDFGHAVYPQLITSAIMEKAASKSSSADYHKIVSKQLNDSVISIKLPPDIEQRNGSLKVVVYDILERVKNDDQVRTMINNGLSEMIKRYNGSNLQLKKTVPPSAAEQEESEGRKLVNDQNFVERVFSFLRRVKVINKSIHFDEDIQDADQVVNAVKERINVKADFIMPSDREMINVIMFETNNAINKTVANVVDEILALKENVMPDPGAIAGLLRKEFDEANQVINDMIARKIAILLSTNEIPPPPYTPLINSISLSYSSVIASDVNGDQFYHITPMGAFGIDIYNSGVKKKGYDDNLLTTTSMFPGSLVVNPDAPEDIQGMLFIGISDVLPDQNVTLLVSIAEGTKKNDKQPPGLNWYYLKNNTWIKLKDLYLVSDSTYGLQTTGIIEISIPGDANSDSNLFDTSSLFWLCAGVKSDTDAFPSLIGITAQVVTATFKDHGNDPAHLALPLEPRRITGFAETIPQVKRVSQPVSSSGGQVKEHGQEYYTRVSERLRHKNRAINNWDYERLVLENFPFLFKVKCLNNYYKGEFAAGHVTIVPIANLTNKSDEGSNVAVPRTSYIDLKKIERFLAASVSPFVKIHVINPQLNYVLIHCRVKFYTGVDKGLYLQRLNHDLIGFLTPWTSGEAGARSFSAKIYSSSIINFIDKREYVKYVTDLVMEQYTENDLGEKDFCTEDDELTSLVETQITSGHSILVSAPKHDIELIE